MKKCGWLMIQLLFLGACAENQALPEPGISAINPDKPPVQNHKVPLPMGVSPVLQSSIQINGKKFLRHQAAAPWRLFDTELSQYVTATNTLVLSCEDLTAALTGAGLAGTLSQWQQIALNTYQASFDMQLIEQHYRRLQKAGIQVEWLLDYSVRRQAEEM